MKPASIMAFLRQKLSAASITLTAFVTVMALTMATIWFTITTSLSDYLNQQTEVLGNSLATQAAFNATQSILTNDLLSLNVLLNRLVINENILSARVYNKKDELLAQASSANIPLVNDEMRPTDEHRVYSSSVRFRDEVVGHVLITLDKTPALSTLSRLGNALFGVGLFLTVLFSLAMLLLIRWLYTPIQQLSDALLALNRGTRTAPLPNLIYVEANELRTQVETLQSIEQIPEPEQTPSHEDHSSHEDSIAAQKTETQIEFDFDRIIEESQRENCVLYFRMKNLQDWNEQMTPLQVANLLTPVYRALFLCAEEYQGQVHQYENDGVLVFFQAKDCQDNLFMNAVCTAQLFLKLHESLAETELYADVPNLNVHVSLHKGNEHIANMMAHHYFDPSEMRALLIEASALNQSQVVNRLLLSEAIITVPEIQNRVVTSLPDVIEIEEEEFLAYEVKDVAEKYRKRIQEKLEQTELTSPKTKDDEDTFPLFAS